MEEMINVLREEVPNYDFVNSIDFFDKESKIFTVEGCNILDYSIGDGDSKVKIKYFNGYSSCMRKLYSYDEPITLLVNRSSYHYKSTAISISADLSPPIFHLDHIELRFRMWSLDYNE